MSLPGQSYLLLQYRLVRLVVASVGACLADRSMESAMIYGTGSGRPLSMNIQYIGSVSLNMVPCQVSVLVSVLSSLHHDQPFASSSSKNLCNLEKSLKRTFHNSKKEKNCLRFA